MTVAIVILGLTVIVMARGWDRESAERRADTAGLVKALGRTERERDSAKASARAFRTQAEARIANLWADVEQARLEAKDANACRDAAHANLVMVLRELDKRRPITVAAETLAEAVSA